jgi:hypothetical protein
MYSQQGLRAAYGYGYSPMVMMGADPAPATPTLWEKTTTWLGTENATIGHGVKNGYIVAGAAVVGLYMAGYLGGKRRR